MRHVLRTVLECSNKQIGIKKKKKKRENTERAISENFLKVNAPLLQG